MATTSLIKPSGRIPVTQGDSGLITREWDIYLEQIGTVVTNEEGAVGPPGPAGKDGKDGKDGADGKDGEDVGESLAPAPSATMDEIRGEIPDWIGTAPAAQPVVIPPDWLSPAQVPTSCIDWVPPAKEVVSATDWLAPIQDVSDLQVRLDDTPQYQEGAWTPTLTDITFTGTETTEYNYTRIGRLVYCCVYLSATSIEIANNATITLPFNHLGTAVASGQALQSDGDAMIDYVVTGQVINFVDVPASFSMTDLVLSFSYNMAT